MNILKAHHPRRHVKSFKYAFSGLFHTVINEPNFRIQLLITAVLIFLGFRYHISYLEWSIMTVSLGILLSAEMINTVVENFIDAIITREHEAAKLIKDISAGFVLITAVINLIIFFLIFGRHFGNFGV